MGFDYVFNVLKENNIQQNHPLPAWQKMDLLRNCCTSTAKASAASGWFKTTMGMAAAKSAMN
jgi:hypothetical protein